MTDHRGCLNNGDQLKPCTWHHQKYQHVLVRSSTQKIGSVSKSKAVHLINFAEYPNHQQNWQAKIKQYPRRSKRKKQFRTQTNAAARIPHTDNTTGICGKEKVTGANSSRGHASGASRVVLNQKCHGIERCRVLCLLSRRRILLNPAANLSRNRSRENSRT